MEVEISRSSCYSNSVSLEMNRLCLRPILDVETHDRNHNMIMILRKPLNHELPKKGYFHWWLNERLDVSAIFTGRLRSAGLTWLVNLHVSRAFRCGYCRNATCPRVTPCLVSSDFLFASSECSWLLFLYLWAVNNYDSIQNTVGCYPHFVVVLLYSIPASHVFYQTTAFTIVR